ncbi:MAG: hypothetical protein RLY93_16735 [Sumerlaeia bacterium]
MIEYGDYKQMPTHPSGVSDEGFVSFCEELRDRGETSLALDMDDVAFAHVPWEAMAFVKNLQLIGTPKNFEGISGLSQLEDLSLTSTKIETLDPLKDITCLEILYLFSSVPKNVQSIGKLSRLKALLLVDLKKLQNLEFISGLSQLQYLEVSSVSGVSSFPDCSGLTRLRRVDLESLKDLTSLEGLAKAPNLHTVLCVMCRGLSLNAFTTLSQSKSLTKFEIRHSSNKTKASIEALFPGKVGEQCEDIPENYTVI